MKVLIISDTHRRLDNFEKVLQITPSIDYLVHCGDVCGEDDWVEAMAGCPTTIVRGNCDWGSDLDRTAVVELGGHRAFVAHGDAYHVSYDLEELAEAAKENGCSIAFYGHTHIPSVKNVNGVTCVNPGSLTNPRQDGRQPSYAVMTIDRNGNVMFTINYL